MSAQQTRLECQGHTPTCARLMMSDDAPCICPLETQAMSDNEYVNEWQQLEARAEDAEARILEYKSSEGHMREELRAAEERLREAGDVLGAICVAATLKPNESLVTPLEHAALDAMRAVLADRDNWFSQNADETTWRREAEAKVAELTQERDDYRDGALTEERRCDELLDERNLARNETLAALEKVEELRAAYIASESRYAAEVIARFAAEQEVKELQAELDSAIDEERIRARDAVRYEQERDEVQHRSLDLEQECQRLRGQLEATKLDFANACDVGRRLESRLRELETPPVPQVAEAMEAMEARRCGNAWHTDCDLRWTHCFPLNPEPSPAQGEREKLAGTPLTVEMMVEALRMLANYRDAETATRHTAWHNLADELERAANGVL